MAVSLLALCSLVLQTAEVAAKSLPATYQGVWQCKAVVDAGKPVSEQREAASTRLVVAGSYLLLISNDIVVMEGNCSVVGTDGEASKVDITMTGGVLHHM